jgi:hypothetical protein
MAGRKKMPKRPKVRKVSLQEKIKREQRRFQRETMEAMGLVDDKAFKRLK